ncbi:unnamed protein product, partial [Oppiella nova]
MDCGFPALPESTKISIYKKRYEEYSFIQYECDSEDKLLVGNSTLRCINGKWIGNLPRCEFSWNITSSQRVSIQLENEDRIDYFSIILFAKDLMNYLQNGDLVSYSFSDSCGSVEKPLHSIELSHEKWFTIFGCEEDFYLDPISSQRVFCESSGTWNTRFPRCLAKTLCRLPAMDTSDHYIHVEYKYLNYLNGTPNAETNSMAIYSCRTGNETDI